ncbi:hypothetical protein NPIL_478951 [Nephila pilipes]|uniref:Uncharacterized protein n=1 Tax=Nephila pilipes TaxID=299642 RepID=A0A8X6UCB6_NEPPI|nr:hypothetical protein NPIL_478951 [Nephila pilipes]
MNSFDAIKDLIHSKLPDKLKTLFIERASSDEVDNSLSQHTFDCPIVTLNAIHTKNIKWEGVTSPPKECDKPQLRRDLRMSERVVVILNFC